MTRAAQLAGLGSLEGSAPAYACRAWVNFNGTGTVAIRASGNVSSITDNGTGNYTVNFTTAMPDTSYAQFIYYSADSSGNYGFMGTSFNKATASLQFQSYGGGASTEDKATVCCSIFR